MLIYEYRRSEMSESSEQFPIPAGLLSGRNSWEKKMATREFDAHQWKKKPTKVQFQTRDGERIRFTAQKEKRVPVHVKFKTHNGK